MSTTVSANAIAALKHVSTATLTTLLFKHGLRNVFMQGVRMLGSGGTQMVGPAYTLRYIPAREDLDHLGVFLDHSHPQRKAVEEIPLGHVLVMDSRGDASAASAGSILVARMMMRGVAGVVTDGGLRDSHEIAALAIPTYAQGPSAPTNLIKHHATDLNVPIGCGGVPVYPGDIIVGDAEGVVVIPSEIAETIANEATAQTQFEDFVTEQVMAGRSIFGLYPPTDPATEVQFKAWCAAKAAAP
jgi:regulator of RNase E activity RraA